MPNYKFENALARKPQSCPPIWFMRQAGRYHKHYQSLRKKHSFEELCKKPELAAETAIGPIEDFDFDVAILFSDILWPLQAMGMNLVFDPGPKFEDILTEQNFKKLLNKKDLRFMEFQSEALKLTKEKLSHDKSLIGFVGGPWTVLSFGMGTNKLGSNSINLTKEKNFMLEEFIIPFLQKNISMQIEAGAETVMIFDSSAHQLVNNDFSTYLEKVIESMIKPFEQKVGYYAKEEVDYNCIISLANNNENSFAGIGIDSQTSLHETLKKVDHGFVQGNFDELKILGDFNEFHQALDHFIEDMLALSQEERVGWVCGLGHGINKDTPEEHVKHFVRQIRQAFK
tara:strand:- start:426 stop:1448 length:1023 start_codon:yes stop_codon:yes gene_type:complete